MEQTIKMPQLGESVTEGTITTYLVKPGDRVEEYEPLAEVMTDKVTAEIPATSAGVVKEFCDHKGRRQDDLSDPCAFVTLKPNTDRPLLQVTDGIHRGHDHPGPVRTRIRRRSFGGRQLVVPAAAQPVRSAVLERETAGGVRWQHQCLAHDA